MSLDLKEKNSAFKATANEKLQKYMDLDPVNDDDYDDYDDCNYEDDQNNKYICDSDEEIDDENDLYLNDPEHFDYECYPINKIDTIIKKKCEKIKENLNLDDILDSLYLLKQFKWNYQHIIDLFKKDKISFLKTYFSDDNNNNRKKTNNLEKNRLLSYLNIYEEDYLKKNNKEYKSASTYKSVENFCNICCSKTTIENYMLCLDECSHYFCLDCWKTHFQGLINNGVSHVFECMQTKCSSVANKNFVLSCIRDQNLIEKYKKLIAIDLIKESEDLQLCPGDEIVNFQKNLNLNSTLDLHKNGSTPKSQLSTFRLISNVTSTPTVSFTFKTASPIANNSQDVLTTLTRKCNSIVWIKSKSAARRIICNTCQTQFCFLCSSQYHAPNDCHTIRKWNIKCQDDSETRNYLLVHTQDCPKCKVCIEKNGGCSHMTCNRCKHEFCWVCGNDWKTHGATYDCNRYKGNPEQDNAREALNRYTHYYHRWINHANSLKFEKALREQCELKIQQKIMNKEGGTLVDWEFLIEAVEVLTKARYTLQYTYPYAYYLENNESKMVFENIQAELEREVENLSHSLEKVNLNDKFNIKIQMNIVEKRRKTLLNDFIR